jgi:Spy/CpxP family protein refolding chaperone
MSKYVLTMGIALMTLSCPFSSAQEVEGSNPFSDKMVNVLFSGQAGKSLGLVEEQVAEMKTLMAELQQTQKDLGSQLQQLAEKASPTEVEAVRKDLQDQFDAQKTATMSKVREVLLPEQLERLGQITAQLMLKEAAKKSGLGVLAPEMIELLDISEEQQQRLKEKGDELRKKITEELKRLTEEAKEELLQELTREQVDKYKKLIGDPIDQ